MSVLEVWQVWYLESGEEKSKSFDWFDFEGLKKFVAEHEVVEVKFIADGLPESSQPRTNNKKVHEEIVPTEEVPNLSPAWIDERRKGY